MKAIFVNSVNPDVSHVGGMRLRYFADALARRGHQIVLLTPSLDGTGPSPAEARERLDGHDWTRPYYLGTPLAQSWLPRQEALPETFRRATSLFRLAVSVGPHPLWIAGSRPYWPLLVDQFQPDMTWATFGDVSCLYLAQALARKAGCPWLMDIKDNWEAFIRPSLRAHVANRFRDAAGFTANSEFHAKIAAHWHHQRHTVVYSGVAPEMIAPKSAQPRPDKFRITLTGGTYREAVLLRFLSVLRSWVDHLSPAQRNMVEFCYAGGDGERVRTALSASPLSCATSIQNYLPLAQLGALCQGAGINCYLWQPTTFHHKLLELLACGRPVLSFPGEHDESIALSARYGGDFLRCTSEAELFRAFDDIWNAQSSAGTPESACNTEALSWDAMTEDLEAFFVATT